MADIRELLQDQEEIHRTAFAGLMKGMWAAMPAMVTEDSQDGHTCSVQPTIKRHVTDPVSGDVTYEDHPVHSDVPIHHLSGGGFTVTHPTKKGDEGIIVYASRSIDAWHQSGGTQQPIDDRMHHLADAMYIPGIRSTPRKLDNVSQASSQVRTDDGKHFVDLHQDNGITLSTNDGAHTVNVHPTNGITHSSTNQVTIKAPNITHHGNLTLAPDPTTGQGGTLTINALNGIGGNIMMQQDLTVRSITAQTVNAPNGKVGP